MKLHYYGHSAISITEGEHTVIIDPFLTGNPAFDSVHDPAMRALGAHMRYESLVVVFGCASDKDAPGMLSKLATGAPKTRRCLA